MILVNKKIFNKTMNLYIIKKLIDKIWNKWKNNQTKLKNNLNLL